MPTCYRVRRPIKVGVDVREPGDLVPEACTWSKVMALVHGGFIEELPVEEDELLDALSYCPELYELYGYDAPPAQDEPVVPEPVDEDEDSLISQVPVDLKALSWPELRKLGAEAGLGPRATKDEILTKLTGG